MVDYEGIGEFAKRTGFPIWAVRRVFLRGKLPEPPRIGRQRVIRLRDIPRLEKLLREAGYEPTTAAK